MTIFPLLRWAGAAVLLVTLVGCNTFERRAQQRASTFNQLDAPTRERLKQREIFIGDNFDMVYIALGAPDEKRERITADGAETTWIFNRYWQEYYGDRTVGYQRYVVFNRHTRSYHVFYEPVRESVYADRVEEHLRVYFNNGQVTAIEQAR
jgi:hypothetical protein